MTFNKTKTSKLKNFYTCCVRLCFYYNILTKHTGNESTYDN